MLALSKSTIIIMAMLFISSMTTTREMTLLLLKPMAPLLAVQCLFIIWPLRKKRGTVFGRSRSTLNPIEYGPQSAKKTKKNKKTV